MAPSASSSKKYAPVSVPMQLVEPGHARPCFSRRGNDGRVHWNSQKQTDVGKIRSYRCSNVFRLLGYCSSCSSAELGDFLAVRFQWPDNCYWISIEYHAVINKEDSFDCFPDT